jgi:molybdenum cofactor synthesis domain-containing protein
MDAAIVVVGDELLSGHVRDANAHFMASRLAALGHRLRRVTVIEDDPAEIEATVRREIADTRVALVLVCGGLGPTHDDRTMEGVAAALKRPLEPCEPIARRIEEITGHVRAQQFAGDPLGLGGLAKMSLAPAGAEALPSSLGVIPAVTLEHEGTRIVILPGPPRELEIVFRDAVEPRFLEGTGEPLWREEVEHVFPESALAVTLTALEEEFPLVKIGSYPLEDRVLIRIAGPDSDTRAVARHIRAAVEKLAGSEDGRRLLDFLGRRPQR